MVTGTAAYGILVGVSAGIGLLFLTMGLRRGRTLSIELMVGLLSLVASGQILATLSLHAAANAAEYEEILHGPFSQLGIATLIAITWTVGVRTGMWYPAVPLAVTGVGLIAVALNALGPGAFIVDEVTELRDVSLFGEVFVVHVSGPSTLQPLLLGILVAITGYVGSAIIYRWRQGMRSLDPLLVGIAVAWMFNLYDGLVDAAVVNTSYLAPFGLFALVTGLAIEHANGIIETEQQLTRQSATMEQLVATRTAALHVAHEDLVTQLDIQNTSAMRLAELSEMFLLLSSVSAADDDLEEVLGQALGCLGQLVDATDAHLSWRMDGSVDDEAVRSLDWKKPGIEAAAAQERAVVDRVLRSGGPVLGRLTVTAAAGRRFSAEHRRLVDLTAQYLGSLLLRLQLESSRVGSAVDEERHRIARDLHDSLSQRLYAAAFNADVVSLAAYSDADAAASGAAEVRTLVLSTLAELRTLLFDLQPEVFDKQSFTDLMTQLCTGAAEIHQRQVALVVVDDDDQGVPPSQKLALYRIAQESLGNALRHSDATTIDVTVHVGADGVDIQVVDDGNGFDPVEVSNGHGLGNMRERAAEIGATIDLISNPGAGTTVGVSWSRHGPGLLEDLVDVPSLEVAE